MSGIWLQLAYYLVLAFIIGTLAQLITGYQKRKLITTLVLGFIGVFAGDRLTRLFKISFLPRVFDIDIFWSILGAIVFILAFRLIRGRW
ncbi:MAG TPA: hypothetical protein ENN67_04010 [Firmicutes bacterium]|nr:hypothetical protein [Bacillota bacterium]